MIEIYQIQNGIIRCIRSFKDFGALFKGMRYRTEQDLRVFGYKFTDRTFARECFGDDCMWEAYQRYCYVAYLNDTLITPDRLVGEFRKWIHERRYTSAWAKSRSRGARKHAYSGYRNIHTFQEHKWNHAWDDEEFAPITGFTRNRRTKRYLPNTWDDIYGSNQKSWKKQSKRQRQWKN